jgi:hypothetical protein
MIEVFIWIERFTVQTSYKYNDVEAFSVSGIKINLNYFLNVLNITTFKIRRSIWKKKIINDAW